MKRLSILLILTILLSACGGNDSDDSAANGPSASEITSTTVDTSIQMRASAMLLTEADKPSGWVVPEEKIDASEHESGDADADNPAYFLEECAPTRIANYRSVHTTDLMYFYDQAAYNGITSGVDVWASTEMLDDYFSLLADSKNYVCFANAFDDVYGGVLENGEPSETPPTLTQNNTGKADQQALRHKSAVDVNGVPRYTYTDILLMRSGVYLSVIVLQFADAPASADRLKALLARQRELVEATNA